MAEPPRKWARGSNQWVKRTGTTPPTPPAQSARLKAQADAAARVTDDAEAWRTEDTGITWSEFSVESIKPSTTERARARFRAHLPELIWNTAALEGNTFTLPEVRTLLEGVTVQGHKIDEQAQILDLSNAYNHLDDLLATGTFSLSKEVSDHFNGLVAVNEAIESGHFRGEGAANGGGNVQLSNGGYVQGDPHGEGGELLRQNFEDLTTFLDTIDDPRVRALIYFASAARRQYYFDGNKRTARLMMAGELM
ncbi:MAG TPA: hypothetical protein VJ777_01905, partial [Mycobacterium sp.]|nr:hypothetical protein [Mycobacterium sp.]